MIIRHCQPLGSKYPTMSLPSGTQLLCRGHTILFVMYCGLLFLSPQHLMGTYLWSYMCSVNVIQCRVPLLHSLFLAGNVVTFDLWFGIFSPSPDLSGSQGITTRCSENGAVTDTSFKIPSNGLQSFLYRHQYGEHDLVCNSVVFVQMNPLKIFRNHIHPYSCFLSFLCRVWSIMERVTV